MRTFSVRNDIMNKLPLISVVIPIYNTSSYLKKCLDSCLGQTYNFIEIVAVNDGSTDDCLNILLEYACENQNLKIINKENEGLILTRKRGMLEASGEYIFFLDSDDYLPEDSISNIVACLEKTSADVIIGRMTYFWDNGKKFIKDNYTPIGTTEIDLYASLILGKIGGNFSGSLIKKDLLMAIDFVPNLIVGEDLSVQMQLRALTQKIIYVTDVVYCYYQNANSIMHKQSLKILDSHIDFCKWEIGYINTLPFGNETMIQDALAYSVLNGLFAFILNGGSQRYHSEYIKMVNSSFLTNKYAKHHLPKYIWSALYFNSKSAFLGTLLIRGMYYIKSVMK